MHDHLLGCHQFQAVEEPDYHPMNTCPGRQLLSQEYPLGLPKRWHREMDAAEAKMNSKYIALEDFESKDHTPKAMQADFPHEYDLHTMYGDAAKQAYQRDMNAYMKAVMERACGIPEVTVSIDPARDAADAFAYAFNASAKSAAEDRAAIVARILADKQKLRPGKHASVDLDLSRGAYYKAMTEMPKSRTEQVNEAVAALKAL